MLHSKQWKLCNTIHFEQLTLPCMLLRSTWESATLLCMNNIQRESWVINVQSQIYIISFFPVKLLSVDSFQKLNFFHIMIFCEIFRSFNFSGKLRSQAVTFKFLKISKDLFCHVLIIFFFNNCNVWNIQHVNKLKYVGIFE